MPDRCEANRRGFRYRFVPLDTPILFAGCHIVCVCPKVQLCAILNPGQNLSALNATAAQKDRLVDLMLVLLKPIPDGVELQNLAFFVSIFSVSRYRFWC